MATALRRMPAPWQPELVLCHVDHGLDSGSKSRAERAGELAACLDLPIVVRSLDARQPSGESLEAWARRRRYGVLREELDRLAAAGRRAGSGWILTAHHGDDQAETLLLRLGFGSGWVGLGGIRPRRGRILRPLLAERRSLLADYVRGSGLEPIDDPTNRDPLRPRNRIRHRLLREWNTQSPDLVEALGRVAEGARRAADRLDSQLSPALDLRREGETVSVSICALLQLPPVLRDHAIGAMDRSAGRAYSAPRGARLELVAQLDGKRHGGVGCDAGHGWRWQGDGTRLRLLPPSAQPLEDFTYTLEAPGTLDVAALGSRLNVELVSDSPPRRATQPSLFVAAGRLSGSGAPLRIEVRNRRPGDRIQLPGGSKKIKDLLIDRKIPRDRRSHVPIVIVDGRLMWIPGMVVDERLRATDAETTGWLLSWTESMLASGSHSDDRDDAIVDIHPPARAAGDGKKGS